MASLARVAVACSARPAAGRLVRADHRLRVHDAAPREWYKKFRQGGPPHQLKPDAEPSSPAALPMSIICMKVVWPVDASIPTASRKPSMAARPLFSSTCRPYSTISALSSTPVVVAMPGSVAFDGRGLRVASAAWASEAKASSEDSTPRWAFIAAAVSAASAASPSTSPATPSTASAGVASRAAAATAASSSGPSGSLAGSLMRAASTATSRLVALSTPRKLL
mmetsp:Transcript_15171/g.63081  ORF Transcript_15171/g.63081 Transcript_15171/m.63081 type:complete len:223 (+) Transcript_15171:94-762(+)